MPDRETNKSVRVRISDTIGDQVWTAEVPSDVPMRRLLPALLTRLNKPVISRNGEPIQYRLFFQEKEVGKDETLEFAGVGQDSTLTLVPEAQAGCFLAGTPVLLYTGKEVAIEECKPGTRVLGFDFASMTSCSAVVDMVTTDTAAEYLLVNGTLAVTPSHLLYSEKGWIKAGNLQSGIYLRTASGDAIPVETLSWHLGVVRVHNLHVTQVSHTFFANGFLVHNHLAKVAFDDAYRKTFQESVESILRDFAEGTVTDDQIKKYVNERLYDNTERFTLAFGQFDRRRLAQEIADEVASRLWVQVLNVRRATEMEAQQVHGAMIVRPIFGKPLDGEQYKCDVFMIMPFAPEFQSLYRDYIRPVVTTFGLEIKRADDFFSHRNIMDEIWTGIATSSFVVADCTGRNPNVLYELGVAHTLGKPTILLSQEMHDLPFDVQGRRVILYKDVSAGLVALQRQLSDATRVLQEELKRTDK